MNIGEAAKQSGLPPKTIRYYEDCGLLTPARRDNNGYRRYAQTDVHTLQFLNRARGLGFSVAECRELLELYRDKDRPSAEVKAIASQHLAEIDRRIAELQSIRGTLSTLVERCHGDDRPDCPILEELSGTTEAEDDTAA